MALSLQKPMTEKGVKNKMNKVIQISSWFGALLFIEALVCVIAYNIIGSKVDAQGVLQEPFFLIPLFWLFLMFSLLAGGINLIARIIQAKRKKAINQ